MNIAFRMASLIAKSLACVGLAATLSHAQTPSVTVINGATCTSAHAVSVTYSSGTLSIQTGGCGTTVAPTLPASIISISVATGSAGTPVVINGVNMAGSIVMIGGAVASVTNNTGQQINTTVPTNAQPGVGVLTVSNGIMPTASTPFNVTAAPVGAPPTITSVVPTSGTVGTPVTIVGTGLTSATVTIGGVTATVSLSSATSITTSVPAGAAVGNGNVVVTTSNAPAATSPFTVNPPPVGGSDVSVEGVTLPNPSKIGFVIPGAHFGANGAGPEVNAYSMSPARCSTTPALTKSWQHNIDLSDYKVKNAFDYFAFGPGEALSYKFTVPNVDTSGGFIYNDAANAVVRPTFISITAAPCNFDASKIVPATRDSCFQTGINGNSVNWANLDPNVFLPAAYCRLTKGATYYMNIRFQDARPVDQNGTPTSDSCTSGNCGGIIQVL